MIEPPTVYVVESTDKFTSQIRCLEDLLGEEEKELTPEGSTVIESFTNDLDSNDSAEIHKSGLQHLRNCADRYGLEYIVDVLESAETKEWTDDEKQRFQDILSSPEV